MSRSEAARYPRLADEGEKMDYKAAGAPKMGKNAPRHKEHNAPGSSKNPFGKRPTKAELLARMAASAKKAETGDKDA